METDIRENLSRRHECPECHQRTLNKVVTPFGCLCCFGCWWLCCIGCLCLRCCRIDHCENCYAETFQEKAKQNRIIKVFSEDPSLYSQPTFDEPVQEEQSLLLLQAKKHK